MSQNKEQVTKLEADLKKAADKSVALIKKNPWLAVAGAFTLGFFLARISKRKGS